jgi:CDK inhibitor PHO81
LDKKTLIQITFTSRTPATFFENRPISSMKLTVTCGELNQDLPRHISLPLKDEDERFYFLVEQLETSRLVFDLRPAYGSNLIGRSVLLSGYLARLGENAKGEEVVQLPIMDDQSHLVGELTVKLTIVKPFLHPEIQIGGRVDTYWKSTQVALWIL